jgi:hypothetical protein
MAIKRTFGGRTFSSASANSDKHESNKKQADETGNFISWWLKG